MAAERTDASITALAIVTLHVVVRPSERLKSITITMIVIQST